MRVDGSRRSRHWEQAKIKRKWDAKWKSRKKLQAVKNLIATQLVPILDKASPGETLLQFEIVSRYGCVWPPTGWRPVIQTNKPRSAVRVNAVVSILRMLILL